MPFGMSVMYNIDPAPAAEPVSGNDRHQDYLKIEMEDVLVSSRQTSAADASGAGSSAGEFPYIVSFQDTESRVDTGTHEAGHWMDTNTPAAAGNGHAGEFPWQLSLRSSGAHIDERESNLTYSGESGGLNESFSEHDTQMIWAATRSADTQSNPPSWGLDGIDQRASDNAPAGRLYVGTDAGVFGDGDHASAWLVM